MELAYSLSEHGLTPAAFRAFAMSMARSQDAQQVLQFAPPFRNLSNPCYQCSPCRDGQQVQVHPAVHAGQVPLLASTTPFSRLSPGLVGCKRAEARTASVRLRTPCCCSNGLRVHTEGHVMCCRMGCSGGRSRLLRSLRRSRARRLPPWAAAPADLSRCRCTHITPLLLQPQTC